MQYKHIIWDYNGTLLNDVDLCVDCMNIILKNYQMPEISVEKYKEIFDFPVKTYYERAGFDFSKYDFNIVGVEFIEIYHKRENELILFEDSNNVLEHFHQQNIKQSVLSAREHNKLLAELERFNIKKYFENISGLDNHLAGGKIENGKKLIEKIGIDKSLIVMIGDTLHDFDVANELGIDCILIAHGHHPSKKLQQKTGKVIENLNQLIDFLE